MSNNTGVQLTSAESTKLVDSGPAQSRVYLWSLGVVDVNRVPPARNSEDGSVVKELAEVLGIQGCRRDEQLEVWPEPGQILDQPEQDICVECPLMRLIDHHHTAKQSTCKCYYKVRACILY